MYLVVSKWEASADMQEAFRTGAGRSMREWLRARPEVELVHEFESEDGNAVAVVGYTDEASYRKLILEDNSPFEQQAKSLNLADMGRWMWSERGEVVDQTAMA